MSEVNPPAVMSSRLDQTAPNMRMMQQGLAFGACAVVGDNDLEVTAVASSALVSISKGSAFVRGDAGDSLQGTYFIQNDAAASVLIPILTLGGASNYTSSSTQKHLVVATVFDSDYGSAYDQWNLQVISGVAAVTGEAADPLGVSFPLNSVVLARVTMTGGEVEVVENNITDLRPFMPRALYVVNSNRPPGTTYGPTGAAGSGTGRAPNEGEIIFESDTSLFKIYSSGGWRPMFSTTGWTSYSPSWTNLSAGTGASVSYAYTQTGKSVNYRGSITLGTSASVSGNISITVPVNVSGYGTLPKETIGSALYYDASATRYYSGVVRIDGTGANGLKFYSCEPTTNNGVVGATSPFTWAIGDRIQWQITYEGA